MSGISKSITAIGETESTPANTEKYNALVRYIAGQLPSNFVTNPPMLFEIPGSNRLIAGKPTTTTPACFVVLPSSNPTRFAYVLSNSSHFIQTTLTVGADNLSPNGFLINVVGTDIFLFASSNGNCYRCDLVTSHYWIPYNIHRGNCPDATSEALTVPILQTAVVAIGLTGTVPTYAEVSGDGGLTWTEYLMSNTQRYERIASCTVPVIGSGIFIAISQTMAAVSSDVGVTWAEYTIGGLGGWSQIAYDSLRGLFIVIGQGGYTGYCRSSVSGAVWDVVNAAFDMYSGPTDFVIVSGNYIVTTWIGTYVSTDGGITWRRGNTISGADNYLNRVAAVTEGGTTNICYAHASLTGASITADPTGDYAEKVFTTGPSANSLAVSTAGKFIAVGPYVTTISDNGTTWVGGSEIPGGYYAGIVAGPGGEFLAWTSNAYHITMDGITWSTHLDTQISNCIFDGTHYLCIDNATGYLRKRTPGVLGVFTAIATLGAAPFGWKLCRKPSGRLMCMSRDATWISDDLVTFTKVKGAIFIGISECTFVAHANSDLFIGVGDTTPYGGVGGCFTSPDAVTWTRREVPALAGGGWYIDLAVDQSTGKLVAISSEGTQIFSTDGISWESKAMPTGDWRRVVFSNFHNKFLALGVPGSSAITPNILEFLC